MRLIDADALRVELYHCGFECDTNEQKWDGGLWMRWKAIERIVDRQPTIDAELVVKHAHWVGLEYDGYADGNPVWDKWECSNCGNEIDGEDTPLYCCDCGAKMDEETI